MIFFPPSDWQKRDSNLLKICCQTPPFLPSILPSFLPSLHTHSHTHTIREKLKHKTWFSVTPSEPQRNMIIASDRLYSPVPHGISLHQQPLLLINLYIYILIYTSFLYLGKNYSTYNQKYDIKSWFLAWQKKETNAKKTLLL